MSQIIILYLHNIIIKYHWFLRSDSVPCCTVCVYDTASTIHYTRTPCVHRNLKACYEVFVCACEVGYFMPFRHYNYAVGHFVANSASPVHYGEVDIILLLLLPRMGHGYNNNPSACAATPDVVYNDIIYYIIHHVCNNVYYTRVYITIKSVYYRNDGALMVIIV